MTENLILLRNFIVFVPGEWGTGARLSELSGRAKQLLGTLVNNLLYFGYVPSQEAYHALSALPEAALQAWWHEMEPALKAAKGDDKNIGDYVVYQNFPQEVLSMSHSDYWFRQLLIYWGVDQNELQMAKEPRAAMFEEVDVRVLHRARPGAMKNIFESLLAKPAAWTEQDKAEIEWFLYRGYEVESEIPFKENLVFAAVQCMEWGKKLHLGTCTDVLRLAAGFSGGDISLKNPSKFKLSRPQRRLLLDTLENVADLEEGVMRHFGEWKRLFHQLHVGEYKDKYPQTYAVADAIRNGKKFGTFNSQVEALLENRDPAVLDLMAQRPGEFSRRIVHLCTLFGSEAVDRFLPALDGMSSIKLLKLKGFLNTLNQRRYRIFTPKGSWKKAQIVPNKVRMAGAHRDRILLAIDAIIAGRISKKFGSDFRVDPRLNCIKLPTNDAEAVTRFPKGTTLFLPDNVKFIRTATYWQEKSQVCWMDNGWNFFDQSWRSKGVCCWNVTHEMKKGAVFSGDPVNVYEKEGKAAQMIDLYLEELLGMNVRYAVWNILSFSRIAFDDVIEVRGLMMMGENAEKGKLLEPSRVNFSFPVTGPGLTKYICYLDILERKIVICDSGLAANVSSAAKNGEKLEQAMPAFVEYLDAIPSLMDIFELFPESGSNQGMKVLYSDEEVPIQGEKAFVFIPKNEKNSFSPLSLEDFLN